MRDSRRGGPGGAERADGQHPCQRQGDAGIPAQGSGGAGRPAAVAPPRPAQPTKRGAHLLYGLRSLLSVWRELRDARTPWGPTNRFASRHCTCRAQVAARTKTRQHDAEADVRKDGAATMHIMLISRPHQLPPGAACRGRAQVRCIAQGQADVCCSCSVAFTETHHSKQYLCMREAVCIAHASRAAISPRGAIAQQAAPPSARRPGAAACCYHRFHARCCCCHQAWERCHRGCLPHAVRPQAGALGPPAPPRSRPAWLPAAAALYIGRQLPAVCRRRQRNTVQVKSNMGHCARSLARAAPTGPPMPTLRRLIVAPAGKLIANGAPS